MNFRTLDLNLLRVFDVVMAERHVTRAAERLSMTQPAVSNALRRLREAIGEELFVPGPTGVTPTRQADALWPAVRSALRSLREAIEPDGFDPQRDARSFTVAMADATAAVLVPPLIAAWRRWRGRPPGGRRQTRPFASECTLAHGSATSCCRMCARRPDTRVLMFFEK